MLLNPAMSRFLRTFSVVLVLCLSQAACSLAPQYERPDSPVPDQYPGAELSNQGEPTASRLPWKDFFTDPTLQQLIKTALERNRDLAVMTERISESAAIYGIERSSLFPGVRADAAAARVGLPSELSRGLGASPVTQYSVAAIASWELDFWGRIRNLNEAALQNYLVTESAQQAAALSLIARVASAYYTLAGIEEQIAIARQAVDSRQRTYDLFRRRYELGSGTKLEVAESETLLTQAQEMFAELSKQKRLVLNLLAQLTGDYSLAENLQVNFAKLPELKPGLPSELLLYRPDIMAAEYKLKGANANIGAARAAFFPSITLNGAAASVSTELSGLFDSGSKAWLLSPSLSLPIFDGRRLESNLDLATVRKNIAVIEYEKAIENAFREVADALAEIESLEKSVQIKHRAVAAQSERARLVKLRFERGSTSYFEVLDAQRVLLQVQQQLVQQETDLELAKVKLFAALGADGAIVPVEGVDRLNFDTEVSKS